MSQEPQEQRELSPHQLLQPLVLLNSFWSPLFNVCSRKIKYQFSESQCSTRKGAIYRTEHDDFFCLISPSTNYLALGESNSFKSRHEIPKKDHANNVAILHVQQSPNVQQQCKFRKCPHRPTVQQWQGRPNCRYLTFTSQL